MYMGTHKKKPHIHLVRVSMYMGTHKKPHIHLVRVSMYMGTHKKPHIHLVNGFQCIWVLTKKNLTSI